MIRITVEDKYADLEPDQKVTIKAEHCNRLDQDSYGIVINVNRNREWVKAWIGEKQATHPVKPEAVEPMKEQ